MRILYNASDLRTAVQQVLNAKGRRVALVAFVGDGAAAYLPRPQGLELVCCPDGRSTNPKELRRLMARGVKVGFSDSLHMKVYWSRLGAVVASANLSDNGLGGGLKELGVLLGPGQVNITRLLRAAKPRRTTDAEMRRLDREYQSAPRLRTGKRPPVRRPKTTFVQWLKQSHRQSWKLGWWDTVQAMSRSTELACRRIYDVSQVEDYISCNRGEYGKGDWILSFWVGRRHVKDIQWLTVDVVFRVPKADPSRDPDYPHEAVQVYPTRHYGEPPFSCSEARFKKAFRAAILEYGLKRVKELRTVRVPVRFMNLLVKHYKGGVA